MPDDIFQVVRQDYSVTSDYVDWRAGVEYDLTKDSLAYFTVTTGHKSAGFNDTLFVGDKTFNSDYGPEFIMSFELGSKNLFLDRKLKLNASAFFFTYEGMQFQTIVAVGTPPPRNDDGSVATDPNTMMPYVDTRSGSAVRQNAEEQTGQPHLDLDLIYSLPAGLEAELHALIMDARSAMAPTSTIPGSTRAPEDPYVDLGGNWLPRTQAATLNYTLSQLLFTDAGSFDWVLRQTRGTHYETVYNGDGKGLVDKAPYCTPEQVSRGPARLGSSGWNRRQLHGDPRQPDAPDRRGANLHLGQPRRRLATSGWSPLDPRLRQQPAGRQLRHFHRFDRWRQHSFLQQTSARAASPSASTGKQLGILRRWARSSAASTPAEKCL